MAVPAVLPWLKQFNVQFRVIAGYCYTEPDEGEYRVGKLVQPAEIARLAVVPIEVHPDIEKLVDAQTGQVVDFKSGSFQMLAANIIITFK